MRSQDSRSTDRERGMSLIELMVALVVLTLGVLAFGGMFPAGSRSQLQDTMRSSAVYYVQQKAEDLQGLSFSDPNLSSGRHPAGTATEDLGSGGQWHRFYQVDVMASPFDNLRRVSVTVNWTFMGARSITDTIYVRR